jgi:phosphatidylinositol 3-kinase
LNQENFLKNLNELVKAVKREDGNRDKKVLKLRSFLNDTAKLTTGNLVKFETLPLIVDPSVHINGTIVDQTSMFRSNLMPCKFVFKTVPTEVEQTENNSINNDNSLKRKEDEYAVIYKIGDDLRQDQLVLQMIALMDKLLKQENLDLKLTPYKVVATGIKEGFVQIVDGLPVSEILESSDYRSIKEYIRKNNPSETDKYGITAEAMDCYVRSSGNYQF